MGEEHAQTTEVVDEATGLQSDSVLLTADVASCLPVMSGKIEGYNFPEFLMELVTLSALFSSGYVVFLSRQDT